MRFFGRRKNVNFLYSSMKGISMVSENTIRRIHNKILEVNDKKECLEIGLNDESEECVTVDFGDKADYSGDIRGCFAQHGGYESVVTIESLPIEYWKVVKLVHTVEHIEWLYQEAMFNWIWSLMSPGGILYIDTPNLDYIIRVYNRGVSFLNKGFKPEYPYNDHPDFDSMSIENFIPWVNYKIFSGCSPNDYHHTCYNSLWLGQMLLKCGFSKIKIFAGNSLLAVAEKRG